MNWRAIGLWTALSLVAWFVWVAAIGLAAASLIQQIYDLADIPLGQAGVLTTVAISIGLLPRLAAGFLLAAVGYAWLARRFPRMEAGRVKFLGSLGIFAVAGGILMGWALPLNPSFALLGGFVFALSFFSSRFLSRRLPRGVFAPSRLE